MNIKEFLQQVNTGLLPKSPVFLFVGEALSPILVSALARRLTDLFGLQNRVFRKDGAYDDAAKLLAQLHVSFLGNTCFYWLGALADYEAPVRDAMRLAIPTYAGPHVLGLSVTPEEAKRLQKAGTNNLLAIEIPETVDDEQVFVLLAQLFGCDRAGLTVFYRAMHGAGVNELADVLSYAAIVGNEAEQFCDTLLPRIFEPQKSLFDLSKFFFSKEKRAFLILWQKVGPQYPPEFWSVFWAEQFWQAWLVVREMKINGRAPERKFINRLPFSFTQRDWKKYKERELVAAHNALYQVDYALKNGGSAGALEAVLLRFLTGGFSSI